MSDISISSSNTESAVSELITIIQTDIIDAAQTSKDNITNAIVNSAGDFIDSIKSEAQKEAEVMNEVGELLIAMANYIKSASDAFAAVDTTYNTSKIE